VMMDGVVVAGLVEVVSQSFHPGSVMVMTVLHSSHVWVITVNGGGSEQLVVAGLVVLEPQSSQFPGVDVVVAGLVVLLEPQSSQPPLGVVVAAVVVVVVEEPFQSPQAPVAVALAVVVGGKTQPTS
jgi:hypothetical protein